MQRRGVSIIEVMISIGVIFIGVVGVIAIFPLALNDVGKGHVASHAVRAGSNALDSFITRGMNNPENWRWFNTAGINPVNNVAVVDFPGSLPALAVDGTATAFCIDPRFAARNGGNVNTTAGYDPRLFPYYDRSLHTNNKARMLRITLPGNASADAMRWVEAEALFVLNDDLVFDEPDEKDLPPEQQFGLTSGRARRQDDGAYSWMATLAPNTTVTSEPIDSYSLSIVIFHRRDPTMEMNDENERIVTIANFYSEGLGGGDVLLEASTSEALDVRPGEWVMLMDSLASSPATGPPMFRWYRVVDTELESQQPNTKYNSSNNYRREVTLQGGDWPAALAAPSGNTASTRTKVVIMPHVVAVYERAIQLETRDPWSF